MDARTFKKEVFKKAPPGLDRQMLEAAVKSFLDEGKHQGYQVKDCIQHAHSLAVATAREEDAPLFQFPPDMLVAGQGGLLIKHVETWIAAIRIELFGGPGAPFTTYGRAVGWMKREAKKQPPLSEKDRKRLRVLDDEVMDRLQEYVSITRQKASFDRSGLVLPYADFPDRWVKKLPVRADKPLGPLAEESKKIAETTGFTQVAVVAWILADIRPALPGARLQIPATIAKTPAGHLIIRKATLEIFSPDVKAADLAKLCEKARATLRPLKLSERNKVLLETMERTGDLLEGQEKRDYWEAVRVEYNRARPRGAEPYTTWQGPRMAFRRLHENYREPFPRLERRA